VPRISRFDQFQPTKAERSDFNCGDATIDEWLARYARQAVATRDSAVYLLHDGRSILGFFTLSTGSVSRATATSPMSRRSPDPVPMILLGRMGVGRGAQGRGFGAELVRQALLRADALASDIGVRGLFLHAIDETARAFYRHLGFEESPLTPRLMMISFADMRSTVGTLA
jgi:GNAT superfamily N-acetyltransferase